MIFLDVKFGHIRFFSVTSDSVLSNSWKFVTTDSVISRSPFPKWALFGRAGDGEASNVFAAGFVRAQSCVERVMLVCWLQWHSLTLTLFPCHLVKRGRLWKEERKTAHSHMHVACSASGNYLRNWLKKFFLGCVISLLGRVNVSAQSKAFVLPRSLDCRIVVHLSRMQWHNVNLNK